MNKIRSSIKKDHGAGFTLIELLIVVAIIAILAAIVIVSLNPLKRFRDSRDSRRWADVNAISMAIQTYQVDHGGIHFQNITNAGTDVEYQISTGTTTTGCIATCDVSIQSGGDCINFETFVDAGYLGVVPVSPDGVSEWTDAHTGYYFIKNANDTVTVGSCESENLDDIFITR